MKNITADNLSFLKDIILTDIRINSVKTNNGFTTTKINDNIQNQNLSFKFDDKTSEVFQCVFQKSSEAFEKHGKSFDYKNKPLKYGVGILLDDDYHMFGEVCGSGYYLGYQHCIYHFKTNTFEYIADMPHSFARGSGYRAVPRGNQNGCSYNASVVYYHNIFHLFYSTTYGYGSDSTNKHYTLKVNYEDEGEDYTLIDNPTIMANAFFDYNAKCIVYNDKIHFFKYSSNTLLHYTYDEINGYVELDPLPFYVRTKNMNLDDIVLYHNKIHFPIAKIDGDSDHIYHYTWDDTNGYIQVEQYTTNPEFSSDVFIYNDKIFMVNMQTSNESTCIWDEVNGLTRFDNTTFYDSMLMQDRTSGTVWSNYFLEYNNELYYTSGELAYYIAKQSFLKWIHGEWSIYYKKSYFLDS